MSVPLSWSHFKAWEPEGITIVRVDQQRASLLLGEIPLSVEAFGPLVMRLRLGETSRKTFNVVEEEASGNLRINVKTDHLLAQSGEMALELGVKPLRFALTSRGRALLVSANDGHIRGGNRIPFISRGDGVWVVAFALESEEALFGLGEKFDALNRRGKLYTTWNEDALGVNSEKSYKNVPFIWSSRGWGIFLHSSSRSHHGVGYPPWSHRSYILVVEDDVLDIFFFVGRPENILQSYTQITGRPPEVPVWSYGVWWSRCYYKGPEEALEVAKQIRQREIPGDVLVLDGRAWLDTETRCTLEWDLGRYPNPEAFIKAVKDLGFRLCLWEYPYISVSNPLFPYLARKGYFLRNAQGEPYVYRWDPEPFGSVLTPLPPSGILDFTQEEVASWWQDLHKRLFSLGVDVMKTDFGEQVPEDAWSAHGHSGKWLHNIYSLLYNRTVYECTPDRLVFARSATAGSQRYPIHWGGDPQADWEGLTASIRGGLSWGMSGGAYYAHDVGGFYGTPDAELYVRWMQAAIFFSHIRFHGMTPREPYHFGSSVESLARAWLRVRMALIPYIQSLAVSAVLTGLPLARALPLEEPDGRCAQCHDTEFLLGPHLLVVPITRPGGKVDVYLPQGRWYDLWDGKVYEGPEQFSVQCPLERLPIFLREGAILPWGNYAVRAENVLVTGYVITGKRGSVKGATETFSVPDFNLHEVIGRLTS